MLRSLVDEVVRRRLWPIPLVAVLVAIAAPVLFMKSGPANAPASAPPAAAPGSLPGTAEKLLTTSDKAVIPHKRSTRKAEDPFAPPASAAKAAKAAASGSAPATKASTSVPVVIKNADGSTSTATISPSTGSVKTTKKSTTSKKKTTKKSTAKKTTTTPQVTPPPAPVTTNATYVDVRFGKKAGTMTRYRVPRLQTFKAGRRVAAMFVGYSQTRNAAVFAVAPSTQVKGVTCRKVNGVCRYVDIPAGSYARLVLQAEDGTLISRRLDVVSIRHLTVPEAASGTAPRVTSLPAATCLLKNLLKLPASLPAIPADACD